jgi:protein-S-isoprenylcysteine O-methyltransferase Ste14
VQNPDAAVDRGSLLAMLAASYISSAIAVAIKMVPGVFHGAGRISFFSPLLGYVGCVVMVFGVVIRWAAIRTLDKQFTVNVAIVEDHQLVQNGLYGIIRHPAYLGTLVTLGGFGLALENWLSLLTLVALPLAATIYRIAVEERALVNHFGARYIEYMEHSKRLIPGIL